MAARPDPFRAFRFRLEISGLQQAGFQSVSGLERSCTIEPYREGGVNHFEHQLVTLTTYPSLMLKKGLVDTKDLVYFAVAIGSFLVLTKASVESVRWR